MARQTEKQLGQEVLETMNTLVAPRQDFVQVATTGSLAVARGILAFLVKLVTEFGLIVDARQTAVDEQQRKAQAAKAVKSRAATAKAKAAAATAKVRKPKRRKATRKTTRKAATVPAVNAGAPAEVEAVNAPAAPKPPKRQAADKK